MPSITATSQRLSACTNSMSALTLSLQSQPDHPGQGLTSTYWKMYSAGLYNFITLFQFFLAYYCISYPKTYTYPKNLTQKLISLVALCYFPIHS